MNDSHFAGKDRLPPRKPLFVEQLEIPKTLPEPEEIPSKTRLLRQGEYPERIGLVVAGIVKLAISVDGLATTNFSLHSRGYWIGALPFILGLQSLQDVETMTACSIAYFSLEEFQTLAENDSWVIRDLLVDHTERLALSYFRETKH